MAEECVVCNAPLVYLEKDEPMECAVCHKREMSKTRCVNDHYVCNDCHMKGLDAVIALCLDEKSKNPVEILEKCMNLPFCHMHGPEHHVLVGVSLLTAYKNAGGKIDLPSALSEMVNRGKQIPGGACGFWGACGAGISTGMFISIISQSTPFTNLPLSLSNLMTSEALKSIGTVGGPRCCKRNSYLAIIAATRFVKEHTGIETELPKIVCARSAKNNRCIGNRCPFFKSRLNNP